MAGTKNKLKKSVKFDPDYTHIFSLVWADGETSVFDLGLLPEKILNRLTWHGINAKLGDAHADAETVADARTDTLAVWESLESGEWYRRGGGRIPKLVAAIVGAYGLDEETAREKYDAMDRKTRKALESDPAIRKWELEEAERRAADVDSGVNFAELFGTENETETEN